MELDELRDDEAEALMRDVRRVAAALRQITNCVKLNYEIHGNTGDCSREAGRTELPRLGIYEAGAQSVADFPLRGAAKKEIGQANRSDPRPAEQTEPRPRVVRVGAAPRNKYSNDVRAARLLTGGHRRMLRF